MCCVGRAVAVGIAAHTRIGAVSDRLPRERFLLAEKFDPDAAIALSVSLKAMSVNRVEV